MKLAARHIKPKIWRVAFHAGAARHVHVLGGACWLCGSLGVARFASCDLGGITRVIGAEFMGAFLETQGRSEGQLGAWRASAAWRVRATRWRHVGAWIIKHEKTVHVVA